MGHDHHHNHVGEPKEQPEIEHKPEDDIFHFYCKSCKKIVEAHMKGRKRCCRECASHSIIYATHRALTTSFRLQTVNANKLDGE